MMSDTEMMDFFQQTIIQSLQQDSLGVSLNKKQN